MKQNPDRVSGREMAALVGLKWPGQFNAARSKLQLVHDRSTSEAKPYPHELFDTRGLSAKEAEQRRRARLEFENNNILIVPEWGGIKYPHCEWSYSRRMGEALDANGPNALSSKP